MWEQTRAIFLESLARVLGAVARHAPVLLAVALIMALSALLALALRAAVFRLCQRAAVDRRLREWGVTSAATEGGQPSQVLARVAAWTVIAFGLVASLDAFDSASASALSAHLLEYLPHVVAAAVVLAAGVAGARVVERAVLIAAVNQRIRASRLVALGVRWLVVAFAAAVALGQLGVGGWIVPVCFVVLFGGIVLAVALALGLGAREAVARSLEARSAAPPAPRATPEKQAEIHHL